MGNSIAEQIVGFITTILSMIPAPVLVGLVILIVLLYCGYENKKKADRAAEAARRRTPRKPGQNAKPKIDDGANNGEPWK